MGSYQATQVDTEVEGHRLTLSNLDKPLYPDGFTKGQVLDYYVRVAPALLPHLAGRPLTMRRYPDGVERPAFYAKHVPPGAPGWLRTVSVPARSRSGGAASSVEHVVVDGLAALVWVVNLAALELHVPLWRVGARSRRLPRIPDPDRMVFDLDPGEGCNVVDCCRVALLVADVLGDEAAAPKTSGAKGVQVLVPLGRRTTWDELRRAARHVAHTLERSHANLVVANMRRDLRRGRVLIDWSQNHPSKTTVAAYSLRGRAEPTVSTPVSWDEVETCARTGDPATLRFTTGDVLGRLDRSDGAVPLARS